MSYPLAFLQKYSRQHCKHLLYSVRWKRTNHLYKQRMSCNDIDSISCREDLKSKLLSYDRIPHLVVVIVNFKKHK